MKKQIESRNESQVNLRQVPAVLQAVPAPTPRPLLPDLPKSLPVPSISAISTVAPIWP